MRWPDLLCLGGLALSVITALVVIPLIPSLVGTHPVLLEMLSGSSPAIAAAGAFARVGRVSLVAALTAPLLGLCLFDPFWWWAGRRYRDAVTTFLARDARSARGIDRALSLFRRFGGWTLVLAYYLPVPNTILYAAAGWSEMSFARFAVLDLTGALLQIAPRLALGYALGRRGVHAARLISHYSLIATVVLIAAIVTFSWWRRRAGRGTPARTANPITALASAEPQIPATALVETHLRPLVEDGRVPGLVYALITPEGRGTGQLTASGSQPLGPHVVLEIGSVTKVFTALLLADLVERGEVGLDDPIAAHLPPEVAASCPAATRITLQQLATHTSGLPRLPRNLTPLALRHPADPYAGYTCEHLYRALRRARGAAPAPYLYSNYGFGLLGHLLARAGGRPYAELLTERILDPLGLAETGVEEPTGHIVAIGHAGGRPVSAWHLNALAGAGALRSTAADQLRFLEAQLAPETTSIPAVVRATQQLQHPLPGGGGIGLGWHLRGGLGQPVLWHNGATGGFSSMLAIDQNAGCALAVLATSTATDSASLDAAVFAALAELVADANV